MKKDIYSIDRKEGFVNQNGKTKWISLGNVVTIVVNGYFTGDGMVRYPAFDWFHSRVT
jgi:hypothetical protein